MFLLFYKFFLHILLATFTYFYFIHFPYIFLPLCHFIYLCKFIFSTFRLIMTEERSKRHEFLPLVFIVKIIMVQSNLDYPDIDYPDFLIIRTFSLVPFFS